jgi:hypothetical protein
MLRKQNCSVHNEVYALDHFIQNIYLLAYWAWTMLHSNIIILWQSDPKLMFTNRVWRFHLWRGHLAFSCNNIKNKTNSMALSQQAKYTDWSTAIYQRDLVPTFADRRVSRGQRGGSPAVVNLIDPSRYFSFQVAPHLSSRGWVDPVPDPLLLRKSGSQESSSGPLD